MEHLDTCSGRSEMPVSWTSLLIFLDPMCITDVVWETQTCISENPGSNPGSAYDSSFLQLGSLEAPGNNSGNQVFATHMKEELDSWVSLALPLLLWIFVGWAGRYKIFLNRWLFLFLPAFQTSKSICVSVTLCSVSWMLYRWAISRSIIDITTDF